MPTWDQIREAIVTNWRKLPLAVQFVLVLVVVAGLISAVVWMGTTPEWVTLYSGLTLEDAGAVTSRLAAMNHRYELVGDGTTIRVLARDARQIRVQLATEGLPAKSAKGYELFDDAPLGMTPFMQHVNLGRALQSELARSIQQIQGVAAARVHIVRPEPSPFVRDRTPTTASVILKLRPGVVLGRANAAAIVATVAHAVEGLSPERVSIIDANTGRMLSEQRGPDGMTSSTHLDYRINLEQYLSNRVESMLTQVLGPGRAIVTVAADLDFKKSREKREIINPEERVVTREKITTRREQPAAPKPAGPTGATVNLKSPGGGFNLAGVGTNVNDETVETEHNFSKTIREIEDAYGTVQRLTVAAMVDLTKGEGEGESGARLTQQDVETLIRNAVGFNATRGDRVDVTPTKLAAAATLARAEAEALEQERWDYYVKLVRNGSLGVAAVIALLLGLLFLRRLRPALRTEPAPAPPPPSRVVDELAARDPAAVAQLLARWLREGEPRPERAAGPS